MSRICHYLSLLAVVLIACSACGPKAQAQGQPAGSAVDLELILAVDVSGSMDGPEQEFQRAGYLAAIPHPDVVRAIVSGSYRRIALTYVEWAGDGGQSVAVPWRVISDQASAQAFADELARTPVAFIRRTSISSILDFSTKHFEASGVTGLRRVIDVSGDGPNNEGGLVTDARDRVLAKGIVINGLPIMLQEVWGMPFGLDQYYRDCVVGGPGSFVLPLKRREDWAEAIRRKLVLEIAGGKAQLIRAQLKPVLPDGPDVATDCTIGEQLRGRWWDR